MLTSIKVFTAPKSPLRADLAKVAQRVYDEWQVDEDGYDGVVAEGGICHLIADAMVTVLSAYSVEAQAQSCSVGEVHVNVIAQFKEGVYSIDINPYNYETGGGYNWKKRPNIVFTPDFVAEDKIDSNPDNFSDYIE